MLPKSYQKISRVITAAILNSDLSETEILNLSKALISPNSDINFALSEMLRKIIPILRHSGEENFKEKNPVSLQSKVSKKPRFSETDFLEIYNQVRKKRISEANLLVLLGRASPSLKSMIAKNYSGKGVKKMLEGYLTYSDKVYITNLKKLLGIEKTDAFLAGISKIR
ncbi:hypothetical protein A7981_04385 [Methylovorus sp. MM2]|uniref:hypothetical protein n=1 Tax=Methylovorus sp. MM2 TaxID=1848038 RepID=UPI0007E1B26A|nr:hypothetical protein [Methylovorus sp. MM2]OAM52696.1 hypothetical protein A7981_04385 [Methylovorus sp. MM2]